AEPLDQRALLESIDGDRALLAEIAALFVDGCPAALDRMRRAIDARDVEALGRAVHSFKGSLGFFYAKPAPDAPLALERVAEAGDLARSESTFEILEREIARLAPALTALTGGVEA